jgi:hypothetical protein
MREMSFIFERVLGWLLFETEYPRDTQQQWISWNLMLCSQIKITQQWSLDRPVPYSHNSTSCRNDETLRHYIRVQYSTVQCWTSWAPGTGRYLPIVLIWHYLFPKMKQCQYNVSNWPTSRTYCNFFIFQTKILKPYLLICPHNCMAWPTLKCWNPNTHHCYHKNFDLNSIQNQSHMSIVSNSITFHCSLHSSYPNWSCPAGLANPTTLLFVWFLHFQSSLVLLDSDIIS